MSDKVFKAKQLRRALQLWANTLTDESAMMEIADVYPVWREGASLRAGDIISCGLSESGETQLYSVLQSHRASAEHRPELAPSLFKKIGFTASGAAIWTQPLGASDAYMKGDEVFFEDAMWVSDIDGNVWQPGVYGWSRRV